MIPFLDTFAPVLAREASAAIRGNGWERLHGAASHRENIAMRSEPVSLFLSAVLVGSSVAMVKNLHLDAMR
ncbi:MAG TPA: hypothetical protein PKD72_06260 [Gemmatales bacterium]|nr:hypothetical protein [Gemmatales bacterium]